MGKFEPLFSRYRLRPMLERYGDGSWGWFFWRIVVMWLPLYPETGGERAEGAISVWFRGLHLTFDYELEWFARWYGRRIQRQMAHEDAARAMEALGGIDGCDSYE